MSERNPIQDAVTFFEGGHFAVALSTLLGSISFNFVVMARLSSYVYTAAVAVAEKELTAKTFQHHRQAIKCSHVARSPMSTNQANCAHFWNWWQHSRHAETQKDS